MSKSRRSFPVPRVVAVTAVVAVLICAVVPPRVAADCGFRRGDANVDAVLDLSDGVMILGFLFLGGKEPTCRDAADSNDTGGLDLSDPIYIFTFLFGGGPPPPAPGPDRCGPDPTPDRLDCVSYPRCDEGCDTNDCCPEGFFCAKATGDCEGVGSCRERPQACPRIFDPVCGCDGKTYGNACEAAAAGVNVASEGECGQEACASNAECAKGLWCARSDGDCDGEGICQAVPGICPLIFDPVCGCDGVTYGNRCEAARAGVSVLRPGPCEPTERCVDNGECDRAQYCKRAPGECDAAGECAVRPLGCPEIFDPVCGCDGRTYGNECEAASVGVNVLHGGQCADVECKTNIDCPRGRYCQREPGDCAGPGACSEIPVACPDVFDPVCGCDGETYGNACEAAAAGVNVASRGECEPVDGCTTNEECGAGSFCSRPPGRCGAPGDCAPRPEICIALFDPVCGCDGRTYGNACNAASAGVSILHEGECEAPRKCRANAECGEGFLCRRPDGECDVAGACEPRPLACPRILDPVCGCDGRTYSNACLAFAAGASVASRGPCDEPGGCADNRDCNADQVCAKEPGQCDARGTCRERPGICPAVFDPVCGCDGRTYSNACVAASQGVSIAGEGECP